MLSSGAARALAAAALSVVAVAGLAACSSPTPGGEDPSKPTRIAFLAGSSVTAYTESERAAAQEVVEAAGYTLDVQTADYDPARQQSQCDTVVSSDEYAGIIIIPAVGAAALTCAQAAADAGIPIVSLETQIGPELYGADGVQSPAITGQVFHDAHVLAAQWGEMAVQACGTNNPCEVGIVIGDPEYPDQAVGLAAFKESLASSPQVTIAGEVVGGFSNPDGGISGTQNLLQINPNLDVIAVFDDETATGVVSELARQGRTEDVKVIGYGGPAVAIERIKAGTQFGTIAFFAKQTAIAAAEMVVAAANGEPIAQNSIESATLSPLGGDTAGITADNVADFTAEY